MALAVSHTFSNGETLTHTLLNAIEVNITSNALALISPLTGELAAGGNDITGIDELELSNASAVPSANSRLRNGSGTLSWLASSNHTNSVANVLSAALVTSGTPAAGIGSGILLRSESGDE